VAIVWTLPAAAQHQEPVAVVAHVLELSEDQVTAWTEILHARQAAIEPLAQRAQAVQQQIGRALESTNPDAPTIGRALIEMKGLQGQIATANTHAAAQFELLLTSDQRERLKGIRAGAQVCPVIPAFQATGIVSP
jgi:uncharacterized membrane protein